MLARHLSHSEVISETSEKVGPHFRFHRLLPQVGHGRSESGLLCQLSLSLPVATSNQQQPPQDGRKRAGKSAVVSAGGGTARRSWQESPPRDRASAHRTNRNASYPSVPYSLVIWLKNIFKLEETQQNQLSISSVSPNSCITATIKAHSPARKQRAVWTRPGGCGTAGLPLLLERWYHKVVVHVVSYMYASWCSIHHCFLRWTSLQTWQWIAASVTDNCRAQSQPMASSVSCLFGLKSKGRIKQKALEKQSCCCIWEHPVL